MVALSSCEILDELSKLGIKTPAELIEFLEEYADYYTHTNIQLDHS
jgi:phage-related holin